MKPREQDCFEERCDSEAEPGEADKGQKAAGLCAALAKDRIKSEIRGWVIAFFLAVAVFFLLRYLVFTVIRVEGDSMYGTLHHKDRLFVTVYDGKWGLGDIERGDVVICHYPNRKPTFVKRVIGMPGDTLWIKSGTVFINGEAMELPEGAVEPSKGEQLAPIELKEDEYYVIGDNRKDSNDSRNPKVGPIGRDAIVGKVRAIWWPLNRMQAVK